MTAATCDHNSPVAPWGTVYVTFARQFVLAPRGGYQLDYHCNPDFIAEERRRAVLRLSNESFDHSAARILQILKDLLQNVVQAGELRIRSSCRTPPEKSVRLVHAPV
jgi:hypothetical protein